METQTIRWSYTGLPWARIRFRSLSTFLRNPEIMSNKTTLHVTQPPRHQGAHSGILAGRSQKTPGPLALQEFAAQFNFVVPEAVLPQLDARTKHEAIGAMVRRLAATDAIPHDQQEAIAAAVLHREELGTTGIGRGVAIPHAKHIAVERVVGALAYSQAGIDFDSIDGEHVHLICLLLSPPGRSAEHVLALQALSRQLANTDYGAWQSPIVIGTFSWGRSSSRP